MKRMKNALMAICAILMGTTFTSCLNSENSPYPYRDIGNINSLAGTITSDNGYTLEVANPSDLMLSDKSYPERAIIVYNQIEGEDYSEGKTKYKIYFTGYYLTMFIAQTSMTEVKSVTPINALTSEQEEYPAWASGNYMNILLNVKYDDNTEPKNDFTLYPYEVKDGVLYFQLVHGVEVEGTKTSALMLSFRLPAKEVLESQFEDLTFTGDDKNIIEIVVTAEGANNTELISNKFKATLKY